jgi:hypothetical protein
MVAMPVYFGVVLKRSSMKSAEVDRLTDLKKSLPEDMRADRSLVDEDEGLVAWSAGMSMEDAAADVQRLKAAGLTEGNDFAITAFMGRRHGSLPSWLAYDTNSRTLSLVV